MIVAIFAHQEERRIAVCLRSLPLDRPDTDFHILVNGSTDRTADRAREVAGVRANVIVHDLAQGGKARTWNHFLYQIVPATAPGCLVFLDGDARIAPGSLDALAAALAERRGGHAAPGLPLNGRNALRYRQAIRSEGGLFGDLYALSGRFVDALRARRLRLPEDLVGDDGLIAAWARTNLSTDAAARPGRVVACDSAGFLCDPVRLTQPASWHMQYRRMLSYSRRHFQNRILSDIMKREGPDGIPPRLDSLYGAWLPRLRPRPGLIGWFDRRALAQMRKRPG